MFISPVTASHSAILGRAGGSRGHPVNTNRTHHTTKQDVFVLFVSLLTRKLAGVEETEPTPGGRRSFNCCSMFNHNY